MQIIPTILTADKKAAQEKLKKYKGIFEWIQLDIVDNVFADNKTLLPIDFASIKELSFFRPDVHLMTKHPIKFLTDCKKIKAKRIIGHIELMADQEKFVQEIIKKRARAGLAVDLPTLIEKLDKNILNKLDIVLLMSVKAGRGGQLLSPLVLQKIKAKRIIGHIELMADQKSFVQGIIKKGVEVGLAVDLPTPIEKLDKNILNKLDVVLLMSVKAGNCGQPLSSLVLPKIKKLVKIKKEEKLIFKIALDGGIKPETIKAPFDAGAEIFYVGSFLDKNSKQALKELKKAVL